MNRLNLTLTCGLVVWLVAFGVACGGKRTMASKSAEAYREAEAKGIVASGGEQHGHAGTAESPSMPAPDEDHASMGHGASPAVDHTAHRGMTSAEHASMQHATADHRGHAAAPATGSAHEGHVPTSPRPAVDVHAQHASSPPAAIDPHAQHAQQTAVSDPHAQHRTAPAAAVATAPISNREIAQTRPASTLQGDEFDAPVPVSVSEASKPAPSGGHGDHSTRAPEPPKKEKP